LLLSSPVYISQTFSFERKNAEVYRLKRTEISQSTGQGSTSEQLSRHLNELTNLLKLRQKVQSEQGSADREAKRVSFVKELDTIRTTIQSSESVTATSRRYSQALETVSAIQSESDKQYMDKLAVLERAKEMTRNLRAKSIRHQQDEAAMFLNQLPDRPTPIHSSHHRPLHASSHRPLSKQLAGPPKQSSARSSSRTRSSNRTVQSEETPGTQPNPLDYHQLLMPHPDDFKHINIPENFVFHEEDIRRSITDLRESFSKTISTAQLTDTGGSTSLTVSDEILSVAETARAQDPSRVIERRRATLAALRLRRPNS